MAAAEPEDSLPGEDVFLFDIPLILNVTRLAQPKSETPAAVTVIDRDLIRASGTRKIADLFRLVPGFQVGYDHGYRPVVTYHGLADEYARRMQVLVDGRSVYDVLIGGVFWNDLPLAIEDIERIEVIRGPNTAAYGSNSFFAVINIITLHASQGQGTSLKFAAGEHRVRDGFVRHGWKTNDGHARLSVSYQQDDGFDGLPDTQKVPLATFRSDFRLNATDTLELQLGANGATYVEGHTGTQTDGERDSDIRSYFQQLRWRRALDAGDEISVQFFHNYWRQDQDYLTEPIDLGALGLGTVQVPISYDAAEHRYDLEFQHILSPFDDWRFVWGGGARLDQARSRPFFATDDTVENRIYRLFGNAEWRAHPDTVVNAGAMLEKNGIGGTDLSPRLALNHHLSADNTLRLSASKATRAPTLLEQRADNRFYYQDFLLERQLLSFGGLRPEKMTSYELGYLGQAFERRLSVDVRVYQDRIRDLMTETVIPVATPDGFAFSTRNEGEVEVTGAEVQLDFRPAADTRLFMTYAAMRASASGFSADANFSAQEHEDSVPAFSASALLAQRFGAWEASAAYYRITDMDWLGGGEFSQGHGRLDVRLARAFRFGGNRSELGFVIQNLGPEYSEFDGAARFDRRAFVTFSLRP